MRNIISLAFGVLLLSSCAVTSGTVTQADPPGGASSAAAAPSPAASRMAKVPRIGEAFAYRDGLKVAVTSAKRFRIGQSAAGGQPGGSGVVLTVVVTNGTSVPFDATMVGATLTYGDDGEQASSVVDVSAGIVGSFAGVVQSGRRTTARYGFAVPSGTTDLQVQVTPGIGRAPALFDGRA